MVVRDHRLTNYDSSRKAIDFLVILLCYPPRIF